MFVAGLGTATTPVPGPSRSPIPTSAPPPASTPADAPEEATPTPAPATEAADPFAPLLIALRKTLVTKKGFSIWDNSRGASHDFHVVLVEKNVRFPPLKARPPSTPQQPAPPLHSPISPLTPTSPLYPDGIIAPIWVRKHREMVPSVFILVLRLGEYHESPPLSPLDSPSSAQKEDFERQCDAELVNEVVDRKRSTVERGIKLAVVLVCSRALLDDPALDSRLSLIRRQSGLDSRASLFVISPVPQSEVSNFVVSFRSELYPAAMDYYREHGRRVRRKRARQVPKGRLSDKGWNVRYDYKLGVFAEMRGELEVALKHYEDSYETLVDMFSTPQLLVARTKRWAEAKVLADCLTVKVCKVYLYVNEPSRCVNQLNQHVSRFKELSNVWGIGEETFEFWSWLAKQYRLFADLIAIALRAGFRLPSLRPPPLPRLAAPNLPQPTSPGLVPLNVLFHPGYYYFLAGTCAVQRKVKFKAVTLPEEGQPVPPAVAHEMKVDHAELIIDLFTKAYEFFKAHKTSRMSLYLASQIALTHYDAGNYELALKFNERIARTYRREQWCEIVDSLSQVTVQSAIKVGDHEVAIKALFSLLTADSRITLDQRSTLAAELLHLLKTATPASLEKGRITIDTTEGASLFNCQVAFWRPTSDVGVPVPFQLTLTSPPGSRSADLNFSLLSIQFNDGRPPLVVHRDTGLSQSEREKVVMTPLGNMGDSKAKNDWEETKGDLTWQNDSVHVFAGTISASQEVVLTVSMVTLTLKEGDWTVELVMAPKPTPESTWRISQPAKFITLDHDNASVCNIRPRDLKIDALINHATPAYLDEEFSIDLAVTNQDVVEVEVFLDILLQPGDDDSKNQIIVDDQASFSMIKAVSLGVLSPSATIRKSFRLLSLGTPGERSLDVSIRSQPTLLGDSSISTSTLPSSSEILRTLTIPAVPALLATFDTHFHHTRRKAKALLDFEEPDGSEGASEMTLVAKLCARGPWDVEVMSIRVACENAPAIRVVQSSLPSTSTSLVWKPRDLFNVIYQLDVVPALTEQDKAAVINGAFLEILWRRHGDTNPPCRTMIPLPPIRPLPLHPSVTLRLPPFIRLHQSLPLTYRLSNPTDRLVTLSLQVEGTEAFVFAGPRKIPRLVLAPAEEHSLTMMVVPLVVGPSALPRLRVFEQERPSPTTSSGSGRAGDDEDAKAGPTMHELTVVAEQEVVEIKTPEQLSLEKDLRLARGGDSVDDGTQVSKPLMVLVLP